MDFGSFTPEQREEWRRNDVTSSALKMLQEAEAHAAKGVIAAAESNHELSTITQTAGYRQGLEKAIDLLTREK